MSQKQDMMSSHVMRRGSKILPRVRTKTAMGLSVLFAPEGTSLKVKSMR